MVWRGLLRLGVPEASVEDAVQDVFIVLHRRADDFAGRSSLKTFIYGIAVRVAKDYRRSSARRQRGVSKAELSGQVTEPPSSPAEHVEQRQAAEFVNRALTRLPEREREALVLVELVGLDTNETAQALGLSMRTCQRTLSKARNHFESALQDVLRHHDSVAGANGRPAP